MELTPDMFELILKKNCLCSFSIDHLFSSLHNTSSSFSILSNDSSQCMLSTSFLRHVAVLYVVQFLKTSTVCQGIFHFIHEYHKEEIWNKMIDHCCNIGSKYVRFSFIKALAAIIYSFPTLDLRRRLQILINSIDKRNAKEQYCILELMTSLLNVDLDFFVERGENSSTCDRVEFTATFEDVLPTLCVEISEHWSTLKRILLNEDNLNVNTFLYFWNQLIEKHPMECYSFSSPSPDVVTEFLSMSLKLSPVSFQMYINIHCQIFCSSYKSMSSKMVLNADSEDAVLKAVQNGFLEHVPDNKSSLSFCSTIPSLPSSSFPEASIVVKKSIFLIVNLLADFKDVSSVYKVLKALHSSGVKSCGSEDYSFLVDMFMGEDDLLLGTLLMLLRTYLKAKEEKCTDVMKKLDPHAIFGKFLERIGHDHTQLLSFLTSDETCCLLYLLTYVKLFLSEHSSLPKLVSYSSDEDSPEKSDTSVRKTLSVLLDLKHTLQKLVNEFPYNVTPLISLLAKCDELRVQ